MAGSCVGGRVENVTMRKRTLITRVLVPAKPARTGVHLHVVHAARGAEVAAAHAGGEGARERGRPTVSENEMGE